MFLPRSISLVVQAAQAVATATATDPLGGHLIQAAAAVIVALQAWVIRAILPLRDDVRTMRQSLFGANNDNGINKQVQNHETRLVDCETYIQIDEDRRHTKRRSEDRGQ